MSYIVVSRLNSNWNIDHRLNVNGNDHGDNRNSYAFGMALVTKIVNMKTHNNLYSKIISLENLEKAFQKARKGKSTKPYVLEFEKDLKNNLLKLRTELLLHSYKPKPLTNFIIRDPKSRKNY